MAYAELHGGQPPAGAIKICDKRCQRAITVATYVSLNEMDCDGQIDVGEAKSVNCTDELENINMLPTTAIRTLRNGGLQVDVTYILNGGNATFTYTVQFNKGGQVTSQG
jgi:hypothetical protein